MASEQRIARLRIDIANADFTINRNREIIDSLTERLEAPGSAGVSSYDAATVRQMADGVVQEASDADEDEGEDVDVDERLRRLFLDVQALPALMAILSLEDDTNRGHFSFETCRRFAFWILAEMEPHESHTVMTADEFLREFAARVGCESVMMEHNPLFFKGGPHEEHCTRVDFGVRVAAFVRIIKSPVNFERVHGVLGL
jgi:hypothetical protein